MTHTIIKLTEGNNEVTVAGMDVIVRVQIDFQFDSYSVYIVDVDGGGEESVETETRIFGDLTPEQIFAYDDGEEVVIEVDAEKLAAEAREWTAFQKEYEETLDEQQRQSQLEARIMAEVEAEEQREAQAKLDKEMEEQHLNALVFAFSQKLLAEMPVEEITDETVPQMWRAFLRENALELVPGNLYPWSEVSGMTGAYRIRQCIAVNAVMTAAEAEHKLGWAAGTMAKACRRGQYPTARQYGGVWLIPRSAVMARLADTHTRYPDPDPDRTPPPFSLPPSTVQLIDDDTDDTDD